MFGVLGYVAAMECSRVQVLRPSVSTSAGQSSGVACCEELAEAAAAAAPAPAPTPAVAAPTLPPPDLSDDLAICAHEAKSFFDVHDRQLCERERESYVNRWSFNRRKNDDNATRYIETNATHGLPSFPMTTPLGNSLGCGSLVSAAICATLTGMNDLE